MNTNKIDLIKAEVERLRNELIQEKEKGFGSDTDDACILELQNVLTYIDSLQEEPVNDKLHEFEKKFFSIVNPYRNSHNYKGICVNLINWQQNLWRWLYWKENKKEPVSEDLEEELSKLLKECEVDAEYVHQDFLHIVAHHFANWQKEQMMANATEVTVHIDAGGYPYTPEIELYDYDKDVPLAKEGDKYKVILIKEN